MCSFKNTLHEESGGIFRCLNVTISHCACSVNQGARSNRSVALVRPYPQRMKTNAVAPRSLAKMLQGRPIAKNLMPM